MRGEFPSIIMFSSSKISDYFILDRYIRITLNTQCSNADTSRRGKYQFRCNVCKDSQKSLKKKRAWILSPKKDKPAMFKCFNCSVVMPAEVWLKTYFPVYYREYMKDCLKSSNNQLPSITTEFLNKKEQETDKIYKERDDVKHFIPIKKGSGKLFDAAIAFSVERLIPESIWETFFVCLEGKYAERLIIPFFDKNKSIYYFQARSLTNKEPKYLNRTENKQDSIFNIYNIDVRKPVIVLEGPIDSMFVKNSVAILGLDFSDDVMNKLSQMDCFYLLDNDVAGRKASEKLLKEGRKVFLWSKFSQSFPEARECKDINDFIIKTGHKNLDFKFFSQKSWWTSHPYDMVYL